MSGIIINEKNYVLQQMNFTVSNNIPSVYIQFDAYQNGIIQNSYGITITTELGKFITGNPILNAYQALSNEINGGTIVPNIVGYELFQNTTPSDEIVGLRRRYLDLTKVLCQLAGMVYKGKLSNLEYDTAITQASIYPQTGVIAASLVYCRTCLRELEGDIWWDNIQEV